MKLYQQNPSIEVVAIQPLELYDVSSGALWWFDPQEVPTQRVQMLVYESSACPGSKEFSCSLSLMSVAGSWLVHVHMFHARIDSASVKSMLIDDESLKCLEFWKGIQND